MEILYFIQTSVGVRKDPKKKKTKYLKEHSHIVYFNIDILDT